MKRFVFLFVVFMPLIGYSQIEKRYLDSLDSVPHRPMVNNPVVNLRYSLGVFPEIQMINSPVIGVSVSYARLLDVEWSAFGRGVNLCFEFDPLEKFYGPKLTVWSAMFALIVGGNLSMSAMYYFQDSRSGLYLRPEIGIGIPCIHLKYGYGFRVVGDEMTGIQRHSLSLGAHIPIFKYDKRAKKP
ncbi:MAG: hypothetical protein P8P74_06580 [Crocinitomicaceae bacterium]|nr:hypothetical protein [Crocinitomicaceae bacterium]